LGALYYIVIFLFVLVCLSLIGIILLQSSKTGGMGAGIAGNSALNSAFGSQGADKLLVKITTILASLFMLLSITLNILSSPNDGESAVSSKSVIQGSVKNSISEPALSTPVDTTTR
tara:strand:- start:26 stop:373 length:348 start_codon:yes stop_codon:yes gene_type:complete